MIDNSDRSGLVKQSLIQNEKKDINPFDDDLKSFIDKIMSQTDNPSNQYFLLKN